MNIRKAAVTAGIALALAGASPALTAHAAPAVHLAPIVHTDHTIWVQGVSRAQAVTVERLLITTRHDTVCKGQDSNPTSHECVRLGWMSPGRFFTYTLTPGSDW